MPGMDGEAVARSIKTIDKIADTPLVLMTSQGIRGEAKKMEEAGFSSYLIKPARESELLDSLLLLLKKDKNEIGKENPDKIKHYIIQDLKMKNIKILLAEDNPVNQKVAVGILKKMGLSCEIAGNGLEAVAKLEKEQFDIVLMDIQMPEMDGYEATQKIRNFENSNINKRIPIIAMTANVLQKDKESCSESGMDDYVSKPIIPVELAKVIEKWLPKKSTINKIESEKQEKKEHEEKPIFDRKGLMERILYDKEFFDEIVEIYLEEAPEQIKMLEEYIDKESMGKIEIQAHGFKGASANTGAERVREAAFEVEKAAKEKDNEKIKKYFEKIKKEFEIFKEESKIR